MQQGLFLLWLLSAAISIMTWGYLKITFARGGGLQNRRKFTGCEMARLVLDRNHLHGVAVSPVPDGGKALGGLLLDRLPLEEGIYHGTRLCDLARALHEAARRLGESKSFVLASFVRGGRAFRIAVLASWVFVLAGLILPGGRGLAALGQFVFVSAFFLALASLGGEFEVAERAVSILSSLDGLATDERVRIRGLLQAARWEPVAQLWLTKI